jgi:hypothetical protein
MVIDRHSYWAAIELIGKVGDNASIAATMLANDFSNIGDRDGYLTWARIAKAVSEVQRTHRAEDEPLN